MLRAAPRSLRSYRRCTMVALVFTGGPVIYLSILILPLGLVLNSDPNYYYRTIGTQNPVLLVKQD